MLVHICQNFLSIRKQYPPTLLPFFDKEKQAMKKCVFLNVFSFRFFFSTLVFVSRCWVVKREFYCLIPPPWTVVGSIRFFPTCTFYITCNCLSPSSKWVNKQSKLWLPRWNCNVRFHFLIIFIHQRLACIFRVWIMWVEIPPF